MVTKSMTQGDKSVVYNVVVVFGDTNLTKSMQRAAEAIGFKGVSYVALGPPREQDAIHGVLLSKFFDIQDVIMATPPTMSTVENVRILDNILHTYTQKITYDLKEGEKATTAKVLVVSHEGHAKRLASTYLREEREGIKISYHSIPDTLWGKLEHGILRTFIDPFISKGDNKYVSAIAKGREKVKGSIEKE